MVDFPERVPTQFAQIPNLASQRCGVVFCTVKHHEDHSDGARRDLGNDSHHSAEKPLACVAFRCMGVVTTQMKVLAPGMAQVRG